MNKFIKNIKYIEYTLDRISYTFSNLYFSFVCTYIVDILYFGAYSEPTVTSLDSISSSVVCLHYTPYYLSIFALSF